jgi:hypothetical protein
MKAMTKLTLAGAALVGLLCMGCNSLPWPLRDWNYELGYAQREDADRMIANRDAIDAEARPVEEVDGRTAEGEMIDYRRAQTQPRRAAGPSIINIGTGPSK